MLTHRHIYTPSTGKSSVGFIHENKQNDVTEKMRTNTATCLMNPDPLK